MAAVEISYLGELRTEAVHIQSGSKLITDSPVDKDGKGESFSPTDLFAASYGCCLSTLLGRVARIHGFDVEGMKVQVGKVIGMNPRRVVELITEIILPHNNYSAKERRIIELTHKECPVHNSLHPEIKTTLTIQYTD